MCGARLAGPRWPIGRPGESQDQIACFGGALACAAGVRTLLFKTADYRGRRAIKGLGREAR